MSSTSFPKSNISWPQQPEMVLKFNLTFYDCSKNTFFRKIKIKLNSRTWMTLKPSAVIFRTVEPLQPHCPHRPLQPHWSLQPQKHYFTKELHDPDGWIIPDTKFQNDQYWHLFVEWIIKNLIFH